MHVILSCKIEAGCMYRYPDFTTSDKSMSQFSYLNFEEMFQDSISEGNGSNHKQNRISADIKYTNLACE